MAPPDGSLTYHHVVVGVPSDQLFPISVRGVREGWMGAEGGGGSEGRGQGGGLLLSCVSGGQG